MDPYIGEIRLFAATRVPDGWAFCNGQSLTISDNQALYALIGTTYGGGSGTFNLPDLRGRIACGAGQGKGLANAYTLGQTFGAVSVTLTSAQMPSHTHAFNATSQGATGVSPVNQLFAATVSPYAEYAVEGASGFASRNLSENAVSSEGGNVPHSNLMPTLAVNYIICTQGLFPD